MRDDEHRGDRHGREVTYTGSLAGGRVSRHNWWHSQHTPPLLSGAWMGREPRSSLFGETKTSTYDAPPPLSQVLTIHTVPEDTGKKKKRSPPASSASGMIDLSAWLLRSTQGFGTTQYHGARSRKKKHKIAIVALSDTPEQLILPQPPRERLNRHFNLKLTNRNTRNELQYHIT